MADEINPQTGPDVKQMSFKLLTNSYYYEWDGSEWKKLNDNDPDPPGDLPPGKFDGQVTEVPRK